MVFVTLLLGVQMKTNRGKIIDIIKELYRNRLVQPKLLTHCLQRLYVRALALGHPGRVNRQNVEQEKNHHHNTKHHCYAIK